MTPASPQQQTNAFLALAAFVALAAGLLFAVWRSGERPDIPGLLWPDPPTLAPFALTDAEARPLTEADLRGRWTLLFFGFTQCPDVCPGTLAVLKQVTRKLADDPTFKAQGQVLFVSVDPARDTPEVLKPYVAYFDPSFRAATGDAAALAKLTGPLGVIYAKVPGDDGAYAMDHTASIFLIDPELRVLSAIGLPHVADDIATRVRAIENFVENDA